MKKYKSIGKLLAVSFLTATIASACTEDAMDKINENSSLYGYYIKNDVTLPIHKLKASPNAQCKMNRQVTSRYNLSSPFTSCILKLAISEFK